MREPIKTLKDREGRTLSIFYDTDPESPREWTNLGKFVSRGTIIPSEVDFRCTRSKEDDIHSLKYYHDARVILSVYAYVHSGTTISWKPFSCPWDSGQVGWYIATKKDILTWWPGWKHVSPKRQEKVEDTLKAEISTYDQYLQGEVYGYELVDEEENLQDSCWGFYKVDDILEQYPEFEE